MGHLPEISVCMPFYNTGKYIKEAIQSVLDQSFDNFEFIIVNDGSTDNGGQVVQSFTDKRIRYIENNHDFIQSLNIGLTVATGKYIAKMDSDDIMHPDRLLTQYNYMEAHPDIAGCGVGFKTFGLLERVYMPHYLEPEEIEEMFASENCFTIAFLRKAFLDQHTLRYSQDFIGAEDYKLWADIIMKSGKLVNLPMILYYYRAHPSQLSNLYKQMIFENSLKVKEEMTVYLLKKRKKDSFALDKGLDVLKELYQEGVLTTDELHTTSTILRSNYLKEERI